MVDARLLVSFRDFSSDGIAGGNKIQIAHESLIANWPRLVRWQTQDKEGAQLLDELRQAARIWDQHGRSPDLLWTGTAYLEFSLWRERYAGVLTAVEEDFAHSMAEKARRWKRKVRQAVAAAFLIVVAVAAAIGVSRQQAVDAARQSEASKLLAFAQLKLEDDPTEALAYTTASLELADTEACRLFAVTALAKGPPAYELDHGMSLMAGPRFSPEGRRLALGTISAEVGVWNDEGSLLARLPGHTAGRGANAQWTSEDLLLTDAVAADRIRLWSFPEGREVRTIDFDRSSVWRVSPEQLFSLTPFIPEKENLADIVALRSWALPGGEPVELGSLEWKRLGASNFDFTPNGKGLVYQKGSSLFLRPLPVGQGPDIEFSRHTSDVEWFGFFGEEKLWARHRDGLTRIWTFNGSQFEDPVEIPKPETAPESILPDASGRWMWKPPGTFTQLWSLDALPGSRPVNLRRSGSWYVAECDLHPSGDWMACSCGMDRMELWPLPARPVSVLDGYAMIIRPAAFSPDSRWLATSWGDEVLRLWPLPGTGNREVQLLN
ncbi:MAG: WD40 repeat domain-containing protein, partial [Acidobacteriota bacterium]